MWWSSIYLLCFYQKHEFCLCVFLSWIHFPLLFVFVRRGMAPVKIPSSGLRYRTGLAMSAHKGSLMFVLLYPSLVRVCLKENTDDKEEMGVCLISRYILLTKLFLSNISNQSLRIKSKHFFGVWWFSRPGITNSLIYMPTPVHWEWVPGAPGWERVDAMLRPGTGYRLCPRERMEPQAHKSPGDSMTESTGHFLSGERHCLNHFKCSTEKSLIKFQFVMPISSLFVKSNFNIIFCLSNIFYA